MLLYNFFVLITKIKCTTTYYELKAHKRSSKEEDGDFWEYDLDFMEADVKEAPKKLKVGKKDHMDDCIFRFIHLHDCQFYIDTVEINESTTFFISNKINKQPCEQCFKNLYIYVPINCLLKLPEKKECYFPIPVAVGQTVESRKFKFFNCLEDGTEIFAFKFINYYNIILVFNNICYLFPAADHRVNDVTHLFTNSKQAPHFIRDVKGKSCPTIILRSFQKDRIRFLAGENHYSTFESMVKNPQADQAQIKLDTFEDYEKFYGQGSLVQITPDERSNFKFNAASEKGTEVVKLRKDPIDESASGMGSEPEIYKFRHALKKIMDRYEEKMLQYKSNELLDYNFGKKLIITIIINFAIYLSIMLIYMLIKSKKKKKTNVKEVEKPNESLNEGEEEGKEDSVNEGEEEGKEDSEGEEEGNENSEGDEEVEEDSENDDKEEDKEDSENDDKEEDKEDSEKVKEESEKVKEESEGEE